ncbi:ketoreductase [Thozetella sp. PMI_491]|nr:ketoreductase [Thozetella sp. PMI_491]
MTKVLLTGGSGFIASHVIDVLLKRGHSVVTTVRSEEKAEKIRKTYPGTSQDKLDFVIVPDIASKGAFRHLGAYKFGAVLHLASPFHYNVIDAKKDLIDPAVLGTTGVLEAVQESCPTVKRVVITSSFAAIMSPGAVGPKTYTEADWSPLTLEDAYSNPMFAYVVSKAMAEKAAWDFMDRMKPNFTLSTINPTMVYGPIKGELQSLSSINTSNQLLADLISGKFRSGMPPTGLPLWVDVRDVALAHVMAMELEEAAGKRFLVTAGHFSNEEMLRITYDNFPGLREKLPELNSQSAESDEGLAAFGYDNSRATKVMGLEWTPFKMTVVDTVKSLLGNGV